MTEGTDPQQQSPDGPISTRKKGCLITFAVAILVFISLQLPAWLDDAEARRNRARVMELIAVGQPLDEAQDTLTDAGFELRYDEPITPTINKDYLQQLVIVGNTTPSGLESFAYAIGASWMPFTSSVSPYVIINADLDGTITDIE